MASITVSEQTISLIISSLHRSVCCSCVVTNPPPLRRSAQRLHLLPNPTSCNCCQIRAPKATRILIHWRSGRWRIKMKKELYLEFVDVALFQGQLLFFNNKQRATHTSRIGVYPNFPVPYVADHRYLKRYSNEGNAPTDTRREPTSDTIMSICLRSFFKVVMRCSGSRWIPTHAPLTKIFVASAIDDGATS